MRHASRVGGLEATREFGLGQQRVAPDAVLPIARMQTVVRIERGRDHEGINLALLEEVDVERAIAGRGVRHEAVQAARPPGHQPRERRREERSVADASCRHQHDHRRDPGRPGRDALDIGSHRFEPAQPDDVVAAGQQQHDIEPPGAGQLCIELGEGRAVAATVLDHQSRKTPAEQTGQTGVPAARSSTANAVAWSHSACGTCETL